MYINLDRCLAQKGISVNAAAKAIGMPEATFRTKLKDRAFDTEEAFEILSKYFHYDENQLLEINFSNARCTEDTNLNKYVNKKKSAGKVDLVVAVINALYLLQQDMEKSY